MSAYYVLGKSKTIDVNTSCLLAITQSLELAKLCAEHSKEDFKNLLVCESDNFNFNPKNFYSSIEVVCKIEN